MAGATTLIAGGLALGGSILKATSGSAQQKKYDNMIAGYDRQKLTNLGENIRLNTYGADLIKEQTARGIANGMYSLQESGQRAVLGGTEKLADASIMANEKAMMDLSGQAQRREYAIHNNAVMNRNMQETRENNDLAGMGAMSLAGQQNMWSGMGDIAQVGMWGAREYDDWKANKTA